MLRFVASQQAITCGSQNSHSCGSHSSRSSITAVSLVFSEFGFSWMIDGSKVRIRIIDAGSNHFR